MIEEIRLFKMNWKHWAGIFLGISILLFSFFLQANYLKWKPFLIVLSLVIATLPFILTIILNQKEQAEKEEMFLAFSRDLVENVKSGTPISKAIINLRDRNYGSLNKHIKKLANQLSIGIGLNDALVNFAKEVKSPTIDRSIGLISQAEKAGGKIETILESVSNSVNQIQNLKKERKAAISSLVTQGYIIFFVFIIIMLVLEIKILPLVTQVASPDVGSSMDIGGNRMIKTTKLSPEDLSRPMLFLIVVQSFFAGLVIGKLSEGSIKSGIKHSFILVALTLLIVTLTRALIK